MEVQNHNQHPSHGDVVVIMVPFPAHSHLNQLLQLSCLISSYNFPVHFVCWDTHIHQAKQRFNGRRNHLGDINSNIHFHEFPTPPFLSPPPNPNASVKFPAHLQPSFEASLHLRQPMAALLHQISATTRRVIVIHDVLMAYTIQDSPTIPNVECYAFVPVSAFNYFFNKWQKKGKPSQLVEEEPEGLPSLDGCATPEIAKFVALQTYFLKLRVGTIFNSCQSIEGTYLDLWAKNFGGNKQLWAVGPLNLGTTYESRKSNSQPKCLEWLDKHTPKSVLYVSFGTMTSLTDDQIKEIAFGLEQSEQKFIWVLRDADKGDILSDDVKRAELPEGYEERVKEVGMVVRDWAPQLEILGHPSTGGFMSHCGWNSCLESISMGVPIVSWPMHSDQPKNAFLVTDILRVGLAVNKWEHRNELVTSSTIAKVVQSLMASKQGKETRKRAEELGGVVRQSMKEGGVSRIELDSFIAHISM